MNNKKKIYFVLALMVASLIGVTLYYWYNNTYYVKTEDARVDGPVLKVSPQISGKVKSVYVKEGDRIISGQAIARLDDTSLQQGANPDLAVIRAPIDGVVIKKIGNPGEMASPGQQIAMMLNPYSLYITANIEETKLHKIFPGQVVDITLDAIPGEKFAGHVERIGEASLSTFSILPATNTSGNFTKVIQRIPVKIAVDGYKGYVLPHNSNAYVKIHIR
ncbi:MAG: HlyD family secretion protein [Bacillota bacterium]